MADNGYIALFPGQGSQAVGMGRALSEASELARDIFNVADTVLGFKLSEICFSGPAEKLTETAVTQPAILTVSTICHQLYMQQSPAPEAPAAAAGHSLGEYSALVAAGALSFEDAVLLVHKRGSYMQEAIPVGAGKMVAILGKEVEDLEESLSKTSGVAEIANINSIGQIVVAGSVAGVNEFLEHLNHSKVKELPVSAPFHCSLMKPAEENLTKDLQALEFQDAAFPIYANYSAMAVRTGEEVREALRLQVCGRVRWVECMQNAIAETGATSAKEFGEGKVLAGLMRRIQKGFPVQGVNGLAE